MRFRNVMGAVVAFFVVVGLMAAPASATTSPPPTDDLRLVGGFGASWLATQFDPTGSIPDASPEVQFANTAQAALALASAGTEEATFDAAVTWLSANAAANVAVDGSANPGLIGYLLLVIHAAGGDPADVGGVDLLAALEATVQPDGRYGSAAPDYDGVYRQSLAIIGLDAVGAAQNPDAVAWLLDQQCLAPDEAAGGWQAYRADTAVPCTAPDPTTFTGPDTNSTALALWAVEAIEATTAASPVDFLAAVQDESGGFAYLASATDSSGVDPNSTALVIRALVAAGEHPEDAPWVRAGGDPYSSLRSFQLGCAYPPDQIGAFDTTWAPGTPDLFATIQAVWGGSVAPLDGSFAPRYTFLDVCEDSPFQFDIAFAAVSGIVQGYPDGWFVPTGLTNRQQYVAMLFRAFGTGSFDPPATPTFPDVPVDHPFYAEIEWAYEHGVVRGYDDGLFRPDKVLRRDESMALLYRVVDCGDACPPLPATPTFSDVPVDHPFYVEIEWAYERGVTLGYTDGTFGPGDTLRREGAAAFFSRLLTSQIV